MISVIIPALNESATISNVVKFARQQPGVDEVIVVDDKSTDDTVDKALAAGARVIQSEVQGKGSSMQDGIMIARNEIIVFLDADIDPYPAETLLKLTTPLIRDECDFTKASFSRNAGRVTELLARPLLSIFFPELYLFTQPLGGIIAGKRSYFQQVNFMDDYGVDIGILIDMSEMNARIKEIHIGYIENKSKPWQMLGKMSREVARAIIAKAKQHRKETLLSNEQDLSELAGADDNKIF